MAIKTARIKNEAPVESGHKPRRAPAGALPASGDAGTAPAAERLPPPIVVPGTPVERLPPPIVVPGLPRNG